jgi:Bacteriophage Lambda NinG protein
MSTTICTHCAKPFERRYTSMQAVCGPRCAKAKVVADKKAKARRERETDRARREAIKTLPKLKAEAKHWMHLWVRLRDKDKGCISCSEPLRGPAVGGGFDAGHYRSVGSAKHLEFDERNVHGQCKHCNNYLAGNHVGYRVGLIERIGLASVEELERDEAPRRLSRDQVRELRDRYHDAVKTIRDDLSN